MWTEPKTLRDIADALDIKPKEARERLRRLVIMGVAIRRLIPVGPMTTKRRAVYQMVNADQMSLL
jgi:DNA-binding Lrp family transcriptional regulator